MAEYYVTVDGNRVAGPFDSRSDARSKAAEENTNEVGLTFSIERVR